MTIKLFIVTYDNSPDLNANLESLYNQSYKDFQLNIINNHSNFSIKRKYKKIIHKIYHNELRPNFSTGHLARNWNQALILGFVNLINPACDIVITAQDDTIFLPNFFENIIEAHKVYSFIQQGSGDNVCSYTPDAIHNAGIWDEQFCNIGFQEFDYLNKQLLFNDKCIIKNGRQLSPNQLQGELIKRPENNDKRAYHHVTSQSTGHEISFNYFNHKYGGQAQLIIDGTPQQQVIPTYYTYPYFEKDIRNNAALKYLS